MILKEFRTFCTEVLSEIYPQTEIDSFFFLIMEEKLKLQRIDTVLKPNFQISDAIFKELETIVNQLKKEKPIQYILGKTEFYGMSLKVDENTLIPRPETEELVDWVLNEASHLENHKTKNLSILDIGTGTGCIPISLAKNLPQANISAIDISENALKIAKQNAILNEVEINFSEIDILKTTTLWQKFDIIVSNPPYVRELEKVEIQNNVLHNEPHLALFVSDENPLIFYDKIADVAKQHLTKNGLLFFEINQYLGQETLKLLAEKGFTNIKLRKDLFGNERMVKASFFI